VDYAGTRPSPTGLYAAGKRFVVRYGGPGGDWKHLTAGEARALDAAGLALVANAEGSASGLLGGASVGADWARSADAHFRAIGMPAGRPIYLSVDFDVTSAQWPACREALRGAASVIGAGRVGIYGGLNAVQWARRDGVARWFWQTYAWSGGRWASGNHIEQYRSGVIVAGGEVDLCRALTADYGQWTLTQREEDDMTPEEHRWLYNASSVVGHLAMGHDSAPTLNPATGAQETLTFQPPRWARDLQTTVDQIAATPPGTVIITDEQLDRVLRPIIADVLRAGADAANPPAVA
jgi:hypothetical protein